MARQLGAGPLELRLGHLCEDRMIAGRPGLPGDGRTGSGVARGTEKNGRVVTAAQVRADEDGAAGAAAG